MKKLSSIFILTVLMFSNNALFAVEPGQFEPEAEATSYTATELMNIVGGSTIALTLILIVIVCLVLLKTFKAVAALLLKIEDSKKTPEELAIEKVAAAKLAEDEKIALQNKRTFWQKVLSLRPLSEEKDLEIDHEYDGIKELDNPTPGWFMYLFYATIIFAVVYLLNFHVFKTSPLQDEEYTIEMTKAEAEKEAFLAKSANRVDENTIALSTDAAVIASGQAIFDKNCVACHGAKGEGTVGPNLTDDFWLHGGSVKKIFRTIKYGVPDKGMISWEKQLTPKEIGDVANYIKSLVGSNPANPKAAQGVEDKGEEEASASEAPAEETPAA